MGELDDILQHYGVKGMKWGRRKSEGTSAVTVTPTGRKLKTSGGEGHKPSADAINTAVGRQIAKKSGVHSLSNQELKIVVERMNLERQYRQLSADAAGPGAKFVQQMIGQVGKQEANKFVNSQVGELLKKAK